jgi:hypothetical protein
MMSTTGVRRLVLDFLGIALAFTGVFMMICISISDPLWA